jgi:hypothetical protein
LPSKILKEGAHKEIISAYSYLNASATMRLDQGLKAMMIIAKGLGADNFKAQEIFQNTAEILSANLFSESTALLYYYLFNWK